MPFQSFDATVSVHSCLLSLYMVIDEHPPRQISGETERAEGQMHSIVDVAQWIPDFEAIFSIDE